MKQMRRIVALGACGIMLGATASMFSAGPATARIYAKCDQKIVQMEKQAAKAYAKGKLTDAEYANIQAEIAFHRQLWGC